MNTSTKLALGILAGAGISYGARRWIRSKRRIELAGRVVVITGASSGLGLLLARHAARRGARLALVARDAEALEQVALDLIAEGAPEALPIAADVTDRGRVDAMVAQVIDRYGRIDVLINNAGIMMVGPLESWTTDDVRRVVDTNFWGAVHCTMAALPAMRAQGGGRIGNVVSIGGKVAAPHMLPYTAGKFALTGFTKALYPELANANIYVTGLYPGPIRTGGHTHAYFKGDRDAEYAWFAAGDVNPLTATSAHRIADGFLESICNGDPEAPVRLPARLQPVLDAIAPSWSAELNALIERAMPRAGSLDDIEGPAVQGRDLRGRVPEALSRIIPEGTRPG